MLTDQGRGHTHRLALRHVWQLQWNSLNCDEYSTWQVYVAAMNTTSWITNFCCKNWKACKIKWGITIASVQECVCACACVWQMNVWSQQLPHATYRWCNFIDFSVIELTVQPNEVLHPQLTRLIWIWILQQKCFAPKPPWTASFLRFHGCTDKLCDGWSGNTVIQYPFS